MIDNEAYRKNSATALYLDLTISPVFKQIKDGPKHILLSN